MNFSGSLMNAVLAGLENDSGISGSLAAGILHRFQQNQGGGLAGLVDQLSKGGLSEAVQSWVGTGPNKEVTPDQLSHALDNGLVEQLAAKFGISPQMVSTHLADLLPKIVDRLTPDGKLPAGLPEASAESAGAGT